MLIKMQVNAQDKGELQVNVVDSENSPIRDARVIIRKPRTLPEQPVVPSDILEELETDVSGQTQIVDLDAPPLELSLNENNDLMPYANYDVEIEAPGYETENIENVEILPQSLAIQNVKLRRLEGEATENIVIGPHTLYYEYPPKIPEDDIKDMGEPGEIVLSRVVVPEYVIVHDGTPSSNAKDYYVTYKDYIKNVASSEIYATWPQATLEANILAIMSFTLNRVYTEWYRNKGYDFTITSSTAYDQKWINGRNIFESISRVVDNIFDQYLSLPDVRQPILTQYCDGRRVTCPNWLSQWGSCNLGEQGFSTLEIIRNYYGDDMYINTAEQISGIPASWPGYNLDIGASGQKVQQMQEQLDTIAEVYTAIPRIAADGIFGERTQAAVRAFQKIFDLPQTGVVDFATWYKISQIYVGITRLAEGIPRG
ncbi:peptidoglycan-binding protein [uncultured Eubacterium sp.]|uniref:peptidoglycan-binding protein n=1 Tax=uncultured Eubacterium sp. TaxID=165185 RepID=UPI002672ABDF|nr:peptidoglycan-binding protein [uncultured Eubacterium sp.]